jgi:hypothetical protein
LELVLQSDLLELPESSQHFARLVGQRAQQVLRVLLAQQVQLAPQVLLAQQVELQLAQQVVNCYMKYLVELQALVLAVFHSLAR